MALWQIATPLCDCFVVFLCKMDGQMPQIVKEILEDKNVLKFGVGIQIEAKRLLEIFANNPCSRLCRPEIIMLHRELTPKIATKGM